MPAAALAQPLGISTPKTNAQLPFPMLINGHEVSGVGAEVSSIRLRDPGFSGPSTLDFTIYDHTAAISGWIAKQQQVIWYDQVGARYLFFGYIKELRKRIRGPWIEIDVSCVHRSECLDLSRPIDTWDAAAHGSDSRAQIQALLGNFSNDGGGTGGNIQILGSMPASIPVDRSSLRNAISQVLAASGATSAVFYIDDLGFGHATTTGDTTAPYIIDAENSNGVTSVPALIEVDDQGAGDVDALWVNGGTPAATGPVYAWQCYTWTARSPLRWSTLDAPQAMTAVAATGAAAVEFFTRQNMVTVTLTVTGYDGWAKGQLVYVYDVVLGWNRKPFIITSVDMTVMSGTGIRKYVITAGTDPVLFTGRLAMWHRRRDAIVGQRVRGTLIGS